MNKNATRLIAGILIVIAAILLRNNSSSFVVDLLQSKGTLVEVGNLELPATTTPQSQSLAKTPTGEVVQLVRVIDGDTIQVRMADGTKEVVRYIGIDAAELSRVATKNDQCYAQEATEMNFHLIAGKELFLEKQITNRDSYGRLLRDVYVKNSAGDFMFIAYELVRSGFVRAWKYPPDTAYADLLQEAQKVARSEGAGRWGACSK